MTRTAGRRRFLAPHRPTLHTAAIAAAVILLGAVSARDARAQGSGNGFLFQAPIGSFALRGGFAHASAGSDIFSSSVNQFTLSRGAFSGPTGEADLAFRIAPRTDIVLGAGYSGTSANSQYRHYLDQNNQPIQQTTSFQRIPLTASVRMYLAPRGRSIGQFAWVPARLAPYVGLGVGTMYYRFHQQGSFVDTATSNVYVSNLTSASWAPEAQGMFGLDYSLTPRLALSGEAKYVWARAALNPNAFTGYQKIDLSGFNTTLGLYVRF